MKRKRNFPLDAVLTVATGMIFTLRLHGILEFMTGDVIFTHQFERVVKECGPFILKQHPQLKKIDISRITPKNFRKKLEEFILEFGEELPISPIPRKAHIQRNPFEEATEIFGLEKLLIVDR